MILEFSKIHQLDIFKCYKEFVWILLPRKTQETHLKGRINQLL